MAKAPIYQSKDDMVDTELMDQLCDALEELRMSMYPTAKITKGNSSVGFGVKKAQRSIAADAIIAITKQIKARPGW